jgi:hypothetical protein
VILETVLLEGKVDDAVRDLAAFVHRAAEDGARLHEVERGVFAGVLRLGLVLVQHFVRLHGTGDVGPTAEVDGVPRPAFESTRTRRIQTVFGEVLVERVVYGAREGQKTTAPLDATLGLPAGECSYLLEDWIGRLGVGQTFRDAAGTLADLLGVRTSVETAEKINRRLADHVDSFQVEQTPEPAGPGRIVVVQADGKGVPMVPSDRTSSADAADEDSPRQGRKRMAYVGVAYVVDPFVRTADDVAAQLREGRAKKKRAGKAERNEEAKRDPRPAPVGRKVFAELTREVDGEVCNGRLATFGRLADAAAARNPTGEAAVVCLLDGERALWEERKRWLEGSVGILDWFHASEYLWEAAKALHPSSVARRRAFAEPIERDLLWGRTLKAIRTLEAAAGASDRRGAARQALLRAAKYYRRNRRHMKYGEYLTAGYPIGTGAVEGACRHLVRDRMERAGMKWSVEGAQAMLSTRAVYVNGDWPAFIEHRIRSELASLYGLAA